MSLRHYRKAASQAKLSLHQSSTICTTINGDIIDTNKHPAISQDDILDTSKTDNNTVGTVSIRTSPSTAVPSLIDYDTLITKTSQDVDNRLPVVSHTETGTIVCGNNAVNDDQTNINTDAAAAAAATFVCIPVSGATSTVSMPQVIVLQDSNDGTTSAGVIEETEKPCCAICLQSDMHFLTEETNADVMTAISKSLRTPLKFHSTLKIFICELCRLLAAVVNSYSTYCGGTESSLTAVECIDKLTSFWSQHRPTTQRSHIDPRSTVSLPPSHHHHHHHQHHQQSFCNFAALHSNIHSNNSYFGTHPTLHSSAFTIPTVQLVTPFATVPVLQFQPTYPSTSFGALELPKVPLHNSYVNTNTDTATINSSNAVVDSRVSTTTKGTSPLYAHSPLEPSSSSSSSATPIQQSQHQNGQSSPADQIHSSMQSSTSTDLNKQTAEKIQEYDNNFSATSNSLHDSTTFLQHTSSFLNHPTDTQQQQQSPPQIICNELYNNSHQSQQISSNFVSESMITTNSYDRTPLNSRNEFLQTPSPQQPDSDKPYLSNEKDSHISTTSHGHNNHDQFFCNQDSQQNTPKQTTTDFLSSPEFTYPSTSNYTIDTIDHHHHNSATVTPEENNQESNKNTQLEYSDIQNSLGLGAQCPTFSDGSAMTNNTHTNKYNDNHDECLSPGECFEHYQNSLAADTDYHNSVAGVVSSNNSHESNSTILQQSQHTDQSPYTSMSNYSDEKSPLSNQYLNPTTTTTYTTTIDFPKVNSPLPSTSFTTNNESINTTSNNTTNTKDTDISHNPLNVEFLQVPEPLPTASSIIEEPPLIDEKDATTVHDNFFLDRDTLTSTSNLDAQSAQDSCVDPIKNEVKDELIGSPRVCFNPALQEALEGNDSCSTIVLSSSSSTATLEALDTETNDTRDSATNNTRDTETNDTSTIDTETRDSWQINGDTNFEFVSSISTHEDDNMKTCEVCGKKFADLRGLRCHERTHNRAFQSIASIPINPEGWTCKMCSQVIKDKDEYKRHIKRHYAASFYRAQKEKGPQLCTHCGNSFYMLQQHLLCCKAIPRERVKCFFEGCGKYYMSEKQLQKHQHRVHLKATSKPCNICGKILASGDALKRHVNFKHKNIRNFSCSICEKKFHTAFHLRMHLRSHDRAPLYNCPYCTSSFVYNHVLKMHMRKNHAEQQARTDGDDIQNITGLEQWTGSSPLARYDNTAPNTDQWLF